MNTEDVDWQYRAQEYMDLLHAIQTGVLYMSKHESGDTAETSPKHLRTGINSSLIESSALVKTLVEADVIDWETFRDNVIFMLKLEVKNYEERLSKVMGTSIRLG